MIDCGPPLANTGVAIEDFNGTEFKAVITLQCEETNVSVMAVCGRSGEWFPSPASFKCVLGKTSFQLILHFNVHVQMRLFFP